MRPLLLCTVLLASCWSPPPHAVVVVRDPDGIAADADHIWLGRADGELAMSGSAATLPASITVTATETGDALLRVEARLGDVVIAETSVVATFSRGKRPSVEAVLYSTCRADVPLGTRCLSQGQPDGVCTHLGCTQSTCGDGYVAPNSEECDDQNSIDTDACNNQCLFNRSVALLQDAPPDPSNASELKVTVAGAGVVEYRYALLDEALSCVGAGYSDWIDVALPIEVTLVGDGTRILCVLGRDAQALEQRDPTVHLWTFDTTPPVVTVVPSAQILTTAQVSLTGTCESPFEVLLAGPGLPSLTPVPCIDDAYKTEVTVTAGDGRKLIEASQSDGAGNRAASNTTFTVDVAPPVPAGPALSFVVSDIAPQRALLTWASHATDAGSGVASQTVQLFAGADPACSGTPAVSLPVPPNATSATWDRLEGAHGPIVRFRVESRDGLGNISVSPCSDDVWLRNGLVEWPAPDGARVGRPDARLDIDLDGIEDLVFADPRWNDGAGYVMLVLGGSLAAPQSRFYAGNLDEGWGKSIVVADVNRDGNDDLIVVARSSVTASGPASGTVSILVAQTEDPPVDTAHESFRLAGSSPIIKGMGSTESGRGWQWQLQGAPGLLFWGEVDDDGVCMGRTTCAGLAWVPAPGGPGPSMSSFIANVDVEPTPASVDVDGDGLSDLVVPVYIANSSAPGLCAFGTALHAGSSGISDMSCFWPSVLSTGPPKLRVADVTGDGNPNLIITLRTPSGVGMMWITNATGAPMTGNDPFTEPASVELYGPGDLGFGENLAIGDVTADALPDIVSVGQIGGQLTAIFVVPGGWQVSGGEVGTAIGRRYPLTAGGLPQPAYEAFVTLQDISGDGVADIVSSDAMDSATRAGLLWYLTAENGSVPDLPRSGELSSVVVGSVSYPTATTHHLRDLTGDGAAEVISVDNAGIAIRYPLLANSAEAFHPTVDTYPLSQPPIEAVFMDVDGDRLDDVLAPLAKTGSDEPLLVLSGFSGPDTGFRSMWLGSSDALWTLDGVLFDADADGTKELVSGFSALAPHGAGEDLLTVLDFDRFRDGSDGIPVALDTVHSGAGDSLLEPLPIEDLDDDGQPELLVTSGELATTSRLWLLGKEPGGKYALQPVASSAWSRVERWAGLGGYLWDADGDGAPDLVLPGSHRVFSPACQCTIDVTIDVGGGTTNGGLLVLPNAFLQP